MGIVPHSIIQTTVSLSGSPSVSKPPLLAVALDRSAKPSRLWQPNIELSIARMLFPSFPPLLPLSYVSP